MVIQLLLDDTKTMEDIMKDKTTAGLLAIFLGAYGAHHFYLGNKDKAVKCLLITLLTFGIGATIMGIIGIIDGVKLIQLSDEEFNDFYNNGETPIKESNSSVKQGKKTQEVSRIDKYEQIKKYKELFDMGALDEEEFNNLKKEILGNE